MARIRALLVGVAEYARPEVPRLRGPVNDVIAVRAILKQYFGLTNEDIRVVVNQRATRDNIVHRLTAMVRDAQAGDVLVFYFSGHGSQVRDRDGDELNDQVDEVICPHDMDWDERTFILDDDLDAVFADLPDDVLLEGFFDCCFWGADDGARSAGAVDARSLRFLAPPVDIAARVEGDEEELGIHHLSGCSCFKDRNVLWAASREGQLSFEDNIAGHFYGVFTYYGCRFLAGNSERIWLGEYSRENLLEDLRTYLGSFGYEQRPGLEASPELRAAEPLAAHRLAAGLLPQPGR